MSHRISCAIRIWTMVGLAVVVVPGCIIAQRPPQPERKPVPRRVPPPTRPKRTVDIGLGVLGARPLVASFSWSMEDRFGRDMNGNDRMDLPNTAWYVHNVAPGSTIAPGYRPTFSVTFDASTSRSNQRSIASHRWTIAGRTLTQPLSYTSVAPTWTVSLPEGAYDVSLTVADGANTPNTFSLKVPVEDFLIVSIGDSYSSGEGNPERRRNQILKAPFYDPGGTGVLWADDGTPNGASSVAQDHYRSHRSTVAWPAQVALGLERADTRTSVTFISLAASGATVANGVRGTYAGVSNESLSGTLPPMPPQLQEATRLVGNRRIDALLISVGANDAGFAPVIRAFVDADPFWDPVTYGSTITTTISNSRTGNWPDPTDRVAGSNSLRNEYALIAATIRSMHVLNTYIVGYGDPTGYWTRGQVHWCPALLDAVAPNLEIDVAEQQRLVGSLLKPLNERVQNAARDNGWSLIPNAPFEYGHGYCATPPLYSNATDAYKFYIGNTFPVDLPRPTDPELAWFRTLAQAEVTQGPLNTQAIRRGSHYVTSGIASAVNTKGVLHPNEFGHQAIRDEALRTLRLPVPVPGFFDDEDDVLSEATEVRRRGSTILRTVKRDNSGRMVETDFSEGIVPVADVDMFRVHVTQNERLVIRGAVFDAGHTAMVRVFASDGSELHRQTINARGVVACSACPPNFAVASAGPVYIGVSGHTNALYDAITGFGSENGGGSFGYWLGLGNVPGQPDNTIATATAVGAGTAVTGFAIETPSDVDVFRFDGNAGQTLNIAVQVPSGGTLTPQLRLLRSDGTEIARDAGVVQHRFAAAGAVYVGVSSNRTAYDPLVGVATPDGTGVRAGSVPGSLQRSAASSGPYTLTIIRR